MDNKGQFSFAFTFVLIAMILLFVGLLAVPLIQGIGTGLFSGAETMLNSTEDYANQIEDEDVKEQLLDNVSNTKSSFTTQNDIWTIFTSFIIVFIIAITGIVLYLNGRTNVERQVG